MATMTSIVFMTVTLSQPGTLAGHSLGGALATLAAYDMQTAFDFKQLQVYTYGAPRTGNHAFARLYPLPSLL
jgi:triacylglycerol lipase